MGGERRGTRGPLAERRWSDSTGIQSHGGGLSRMNRREFIYTGTAAAAAAARALDARAYSAINGANGRVGLGVIGTGRRAADVCRAFAQDERVEFRGLCDIYDKQIGVFRDRFKDRVAQAKVSVEYQELLANKD